MAANKAAALEARLAELLQEIEELRVKNMELTLQALADSGQMIELEAARKDAERLDWLQAQKEVTTLRCGYSSGMHPCIMHGKVMTSSVGDTVRAAIDAAREGEKR